MIFVSTQVRLERVSHISITKLAQCSAIIIPIHFYDMLIYMNARNEYLLTSLPVSEAVTKLSSVFATEKRLINLCNQFSVKVMFSLCILLKLVVLYRQNCFETITQVKSYFNFTCFMFFGSFELTKKRLYIQNILDIFFLNKSTALESIYHGEKLAEI